MFVAAIFLRAKRMFVTIEPSSRMAKYVSILRYRTSAQENSTFERIKKHTNGEKWHLI